MTDRSITYEFRGKFDSLRTGLASNGRAVREFGGDLMALSAKGERMRRGLDHFGSQAGRTALALGGAFALITTKAANFEQAMSFVKAATNETADNMKDLRDAALDAGARTAYSATEAAGAIEELAKAGVSTKDILKGGLNGALNLAAAGGLDVADAAETAASAMTQFKLQGTDVPHIADLLASGASKAQGSVDDLGQALAQSGLVASQTGLSIEETTGALSAFASAGLLGSDSGTAFKQLLLSLNPSSKQAAEIMKTLGINAYDAQGNFVGLARFAGRLSAGLKDLTTEQRNAALKTLFGSDAIRAANVLYEQGAKGIRGWTKNVDDAGFASKTAATRMDNLKGDLEQLGGALETAFIGAGEGETGFLRSTVQDLTDLVNAFNELPGPVKSATGALAGVGAVGAGGFWFTSKAITSIADTRQALTDLGLRSADTEKKMSKLGMVGRGVAGAGGLGLIATGANEADGALGGLEIAAGGALAGFAVGGPWGAAIGGAAGGLVGLAKATDRSKDAAIKSMTTWETYRDTMDDVTGATTRATKAMVIQDLQQSGLLEKAGKLGIDKQLLVDGILGEKGAREQLASALQAERDSLTEVGKAEYAKHKDDGRWNRELTDSLQRRWDLVDAIAAETGEVAKANKARIEEIALINGLPTEVVTEFSTNAPKTLGEVEALATRYSLTPKQVRTAIELLGIKASRAEINELIRRLKEADALKATPSVEIRGIGGAISGIQGIKDALAGVRDKTVTVTINGKRTQAAVGTPGGVSDLVSGGTKKGRASGGYTGDGGKYEPAGIVHRGEVVIPQELVQRDRGLLKEHYGHLPGMESLASGGLAGFTSSSRGDRDTREAGSALKELAKSAKALNKQLDKVTSRRDNLLSARSDLSGAVSSGLMSDLWGSGEWSNSDPFSILRADIAQARRFGADRATLYGKGLRGAALEDVLRAGAEDPSRLSEAARWSTAQVRQYQSLFTQRAQLVGTVSRSAGGAVYDARLIAITKELREVQKAVKENTRAQHHEQAKNRKHDRGTSAKVARSGDRGTVKR